MRTPALALAACSLSFLGSLGCQQVAPVSTALVSGERGVTSVAVDDAFVYWTTAGGATKQASLDTGEIVVLSQTPGLPSNITLDDDNVYWSVDANLMKIAKIGGSALTFPQKATINRITLDDENLYWSDVDDLNNVNKIAKDGTSMASLASSENPLAVLAGSANLLFGDESTSSTSSTTGGVGGGGTGGSSAAGAGLVDAVPVTGGNTTTVLSTGSNVRALLNDSIHLFTASGGAAGGITVSGIDGSNAMTLATDATTVNLSSDTNNLYWSNQTGAVQLVPIVGGSTFPLVQGPNGSVSMTTDATNVYWANTSDSGIFAMPKPM